MVFSWHFLHATNGFPIAFSYTPTLVPLALLDEGHTGVALFMTLSGYLFAKLLAGKSINYAAFLWNRVLRLLPLLSLVILAVGLITWLQGGNLGHYASTVSKGFLLPTLPNGGWSITAEFHYYVILPLFLLLLRVSRLLPLAILAASITLRFYLHQKTGEVQSYAYWTIIGRIDQFALGMLVYQFRSYFTQRHFLVVSIILAFLMFYWGFDHQGGFYQNARYPSPSLLWVVLPTIEGAVYAIAIAWYDNSFTPSTAGISGFIGRIGEYSYSIYLLHYFVVFYAAGFIHARIMPLSNFYTACLCALICFLAMLPLGYLSYRFIEAPCLKLRRRYIQA